MSGIDPEALYHQVLSMGTEDMHGLYEILWSLNVSHPDVPMELKISESRGAVLRLLEDGLIALHHRVWHPSEELGQVPRSETDEVLALPSSWEPGEKHVGFVATDEGVAAYFGASQG